MVKIYSLTLFLIVFFIGGLKAQVPVMNPITGASVVCSPPASAAVYSASASNSPTSYSWTVIPSAGVVIATPTNSTTSISYPTPNGSYTVICYATNGSGTGSPVTFVVNVFETPNVTFSGATSFCQGSSTNIMASSTMMSASPTISYMWSPPTGLNTTVGQFVSASPTTNTTYSVLAINGSCSSTGTIAITVNPLPTINAFFTSSVICLGDPATLLASGGVSSSYVASPFFPIGSPYYWPTSQQFTVVGTNSLGCSGQGVANLVVNPPAAISIVATPSMACMGQSVALTFSGTSTSYSVNSVPCGNSLAVTPTVATTYYVTGITSQGCSGTNSITINIGCVGISNPIFNETVGLTAYPNPSNGQFILNSGHDEIVRIVNELGQLVKTLDLKTDTETKVEGLDPGVYFVLSQRTRIKIIVLQ